MDVPPEKFLNPSGCRWIATPEFTEDNATNALTGLEIKNLPTSWYLKRLYEEFLIGVFKSHSSASRNLKSRPRIVRRFPG